MSLPWVQLVSAEVLSRVDDVRVFDLRSPSEYAEDRLWNAQNLPLFDDMERAIVGTLYSKESPETAFMRGLEFVKKNLPAMLEVLLEEDCPAHEVWQSQLEELGADFGARIKEAPRKAALRAPQSGDLVLYCWRGGMRSRSVALLLNALGFDHVFVLEGGYKAYRNWVRDKLDNLSENMPLLVLRGMTGVGKTEVLQALEAAQPGSTIDLEGLAQHRSSILGAVGLEPHSQKYFETLLVRRLRQLGPQPWFIEAESRKVGNIILPNSLYRALKKGRHVVLDAPLSYRVQRLGKEYRASSTWQADVAAQLPFLEERLGKKWQGVLSALLENDEWEQVTELLLTHYYDQRYGKTLNNPAPERTYDVRAPDLCRRLLDFRAEAEPVSSVP